MADWKSVVGPLLEEFAPKITTVLAGEIPVVGPFVSGIAGDLVGKFIADQFGVDATPEAVSAAIAASPPDIVQSKLQAAEAEAVAKWPALAEIEKAKADVAIKTTESVNATIREEYAEKTFSFWDKWRAIHAFELTAECPFVLGMFAYLLFNGRVAELNMIVNMSGLITVYIAARFGVLGVHVNALSNERQTAMTGQPTSGPVGNLVASVKGRVAAAAGR